MNPPKLELRCEVVQERPEPMFRVGQIAVMKSMKRELPFRVTSVKWDDGWFYGWNSRNESHESMMRKATLDEIGAEDLLAELTRLRAENAELRNR